MLVVVSRPRHDMRVNVIFVQDCPMGRCVAGYEETSLCALSQNWHSLYNLITCMMSTLTQLLEESHTLGLVIGLSTFITIGRSMECSVDGG